MKERELIDAIAEFDGEQMREGNKKYLVVLNQGKLLKILRFDNREKILKYSIFLIIGLLILAGVFRITFSLSSKNRVVSNNVIISVEKMREQARLEVLSISDTEIIVEDEKANKDAIQAWTQFTGTGVFTVDLANSDFIVDQLRKTVWIRTPNVEIENFTLEYGKTKQLFFMNDFTNDSYKDGADLAQKQLSQAYKNIHETIVSNPYYYDSARKSAQQIIVSLVRGLNKNIPDLTVDVQVGVL